MAKKKQAHFIQRDIDGTFFCSKCGQAGFKSIQQGYGHLRVCKGYASVISEAKKEVARSDEAIQNLAQKYLPEAGRGGGLPTCLPSASGRPSGRPSMPLMEASKNNTDEKYNLVVRENYMLRGEKAQLEKVAFNHNIHAIAPMTIQNRTFSGPQDLVSSVLGELSKNEIIKYVLLVGGAIWVVHWITGMLSDIDSRSKRVKR